jgi:diphthine methyl ester synthase
MVLWVIGLGLGNERDVTVQGLEAIRGSSKVILENYTSVLGVDVGAMEAYYGKPITIADRTFCEADDDVAESICKPALEADVAFLVVGDPFCATTHSDLQLRAEEMGVEVRVVHNAGVMGAVGCCGLSLYTYGQCVSLCFFTETYRPDSFYEKLNYNRRGGMHTLCLLDIKVKEPDFGAMAKGREVYLPPRYMTCAEAAAQLIEVEEKHGRGVYSAQSICVGMARLGQPDQKIVACTLAQMAEMDMGAPLHCLALCGEMHELEAKALERYGYAGGADCGWGGRDGSVRAGGYVGIAEAEAETAARNAALAAAAEGGGEEKEEGEEEEKEEEEKGRQGGAGGAGGASAAGLGLTLTQRAAAAPAPKPKVVEEFTSEETDGMAKAAELMDAFGDTSSDEDA